MPILKTMIVLVAISFIGGAILGNYIPNEVKQSFGGSLPSIPSKPVEVNIPSPPIEEFPEEYTIPTTIDIGRADKVIIKVPSLKYGEIIVNIPVNNRC